MISKEEENHNASNNAKYAVEHSYYTSDYFAKHLNPGFGSKKKSRKIKKRSKRTSKRKSKKSQKRSKTLHRRSFGTGTSQNLKTFLVVIILAILRSAIFKKDKTFSQKFQEEIAILESNAISSLSVQSLIDILDRLVGPKIRTGLIMGTIVLKIATGV